MILQTKTAFKALLVFAIFASFIATGCNDEKKEETKESIKTDTISAPVTPPVVDTTIKDTNDAPKPGPVTPVN